jgi:2-dehydro-3-deoxyphosphogluconate aldolase/(4S)-4-hydroxy-2-oxoglutarate aldolase
MNAAGSLHRLMSARALVLVRAEQVPDAVLDAFVDGGLRALEISMVARDAEDTLRRLSTRHPELHVGAGTVRTVDQAAAAVDAGAAFLVSPSAAPGVAEWARDHDILHVPGVFTATEVDEALLGGAPLLKLFPAGRMGPDYIRDLRAPFPAASFFVSGGVRIDDARDYLAAGAAAIGMGGALAASSDADEIRRLSTLLMKAVAR